MSGGSRRFTERTPWRLRSRDAGVAPGRATLLQPRPWFASAKCLLLLLGLLAVYAYGWRFTKIDLPELLKGTKFVRPFVVDLVRPDVVSRDVQVQEVQLGMSVDAAVAPEDVAPPAGGPQLSVPTRVTAVGAQLQGTGRGVRPNASRALFWVNPIRDPQPGRALHTGAAG